MPRTTSKQYLQAYRYLRGLWLESEGHYAVLLPHEQWYLHDYFRPSEQLADEVLLAHRHVISRRRPSLPQSAGRALVKLQAEMGRLASLPAAAVAVAGGRRRVTRVTNVQVRQVVLPKPDVDKLARLLVQMAKEQQQRQRRERP